MIGEDMKRIIFTLCLIMIVTLVNFCGGDIYYEYKIYSFRNSYAGTICNEYYKPDNLNFVKENFEIELNSRQDIIDSLYTFLNSGDEVLKRYCAKEYITCEDDINSIASDEDLLSYINSFVHPYNSFFNITFSYDKLLRLEVTYNKIYSNKDILMINEEIGNFIKENVSPAMDDYDKIKIFHDYIIDNTEYDLLKRSNLNDNTYRSNTAYGPLFEGYAICSGYADVMAIYLDMLGIVNYKISNDTHIWNLVYVNGEWLHLDLTWDDPVYEDGNIGTIDYDYFLIDTNELKKRDSDEHYFDENVYIEAK